MSRFLLEPTPTDGGGGPVAPVGSQQQQNGAPQTQPMPASLNPRPDPPSTPNKPAKQGEPHPDLANAPAKPGDPPRVAPIWVAPDDWTAQQTELQRLRSFKAEADLITEQKEQEKIRLMAEKGQLKEAFDLQQANFTKKLNEYATQAKTIENEWLDEKRTAAISEALTGRAFTGADPAKTAAMVRRLLEGEVEAVRDERGRPIIRDKATLKPASEFLKERLESPEFAVFFAATNRGGSGSDGTRPAAATPKNGDPNAAFATSFLEKQADARNARF